jgi:serine/threonine protein kinase
VEALTGTLPRRTPDGTIAAAALSDLLGSVDAGRRAALQQILSGCLAEDPNQRPSSAMEISEKLVRVLRAPGKAASSATA